MKKIKYDKVSKASNPKDAIGSTKMPIHLWPLTATLMGCLGFLDGCLKYGRSNFRPMGVRASTYFDACCRHLFLWFEGEDVDPDSGLPHLAHALACLAIIVDAQATGNLNDDRMFAGGYQKLVRELTPHVTRLKELHKHRSPKHYSIQDSNALKETSCRKTRRRTPRPSPDQRIRKRGKVVGIRRRSRASTARSTGTASIRGAASSSARDRAAPGISRAVTSTNGD